MKLLAKVSYNGKNYQGWQKQVDARTVQEEIEKCLSKILNMETKIVGSGRTDAGVHALGQTFHFEVNKEIDIAKLRYALNCLLNDDIHIISIKEVDASFHARFDAKQKHYVYALKKGENDPFDNMFTYNYLGDLDFALIKLASKQFLGKHNFQNFTSKEEDENGFIREIFDITIEEVNKDKILIHFYGNGFMRYMIRFMVGVLIAIGEHRIPISFIDENLNTAVRKTVTYKAPSEGLLLQEVIY